MIRNNAAAVDSESSSSLELPPYIPDGQRFEDALDQARAFAEIHDQVLCVACFETDASIELGAGESAPSQLQREAESDSESINRLQAGVYQGRPSIMGLSKDVTTFVDGLRKHARGSTPLGKRPIDLLVYPWTPWTLPFEGDATNRLNLNGSAASFRCRPITRPVPVWKRAFDIVFSLLAIVVLSPLLLLFAIIIKLTSRGPVLFKQKREGKDGRVFEILKFRTMRVGAAAEQEKLRHLNEVNGPAFKIKDDPRLTRIGKLLRSSCADELPQFFNVLRGDMSVVGPRPLPVEESRACEIWQRRRLEVLPGMTCFWQVGERNGITFEQWMESDLKYVEEQAFWLDLTLVAKTVGIVLRSKGSG